MPQTKAAKGDAEQLVRTIMTGNRTAESTLIREYGRGVLFVLRREARNKEAVKDLYQETFRIAIEKIRGGDLRDPRKLGAFLSSTARFVVIDHFRREAKHENKPERNDVSLSPPRMSQLNVLIQKENTSLVRRLIGELKSERDRAILFRFYIAQDDKHDICRDLDLTSLHFNRVLHRAKQRYKALFIESVGDLGSEISMTS